jgi:hypothetical protein
VRALVSLARSEEAPAGGDAAIRELIVAAFAKQPRGRRTSASWSKSLLPNVEHHRRRARAAGLHRHH